MGHHNLFGKQGEQIAMDFLVRKGYKVLAHNYRYLRAEIDIIAVKEDVLAIVEVKSRTEDFMADIQSVINRKKINMLVSAADHYVQQNDLEAEVRFDVIVVLKKTGGRFTVEHLENAFHHF